MTRENVLRDLSDGLVMRRAAAQDAEALVEFNGRIHREGESKEPEEHVAGWTRDLMRGDHPTFEVGDFTIVEDTRLGKIVSSMNLIPQTWSYEGVTFEVGRPELVGTDPEYRRRGLVRAQFEVIHQWSEERGHHVQAITGIPNYYRQFGYEMGLDLGGGRVGYLVHIPKLKNDQEEPYRVRPATEDDIPSLMEFQAESSKRQVVSCVRDERLWRYELTGKSEKNVNRVEIRVVESVEGQAVGYLIHPYRLWGPSLVLQKFELRAGVSWLAVTPSVLRYIKETGEAYAERAGKDPFGAFAMWLGSEHPVYDVIADRLPRQRDPYAWYVRVPDLPAFLQHIGSALERRLADSSLVGHTGELKLNFFREGLKLAFESGRLKDVERYQPGHSDDGDVLFPGLSFLQVLFGYHSFAELEAAFADCYVRSDQGRALVPVLFPKRGSNVWPLA
jgi:GNAT superfamily N-acetyltransferase